MQLALLMNIPRLCPGLGWGFSHSRRQGNTVKDDRHGNNLIGVELAHGGRMFRETEQGHKQQGWSCETWDRMKTLQEAEQAFLKLKLGASQSVVVIILLELATKFGCHVCFPESKLQSLFRAEGKPPPLSFFQSHMKFKANS